MLRTEFLTKNRGILIVIFWLQFKSFDADDLTLEIEIFKKTGKNKFNPDDDNPCFLIKLKHTDLGINI